MHHPVQFEPSKPGREMATDGLILGRVIATAAPSLMPAAGFAGRGDTGLMRPRGAADMAPAGPAHFYPCDDSNR